MRLLVTATKLGGHLVSASFTRDARVDSTPGGDAVLMIGDKPQPPSTEQTAYYKVLEATTAELIRLHRSGYDLKLAVACRVSTILSSSFCVTACG